MENWEAQLFSNRGYENISVGNNAVYGGKSEHGLIVVCPEQGSKIVVVTSDNSSQSGDEANKLRDSIRETLEKAFHQ